MNRTLATTIVGIAVVLGLTLGLGLGLPQGGTHVVPPMFAATMLGLGLVLIGAGFYRRR
jgi:lipopolysaccharide export LptBFGC system permease protein LptF